MSLVVVKCGGAAARDAAASILQLAREHAVCVVHGAGPQISAELRRRGLPVEFVRGRRVTSAAALEVVQESLACVNAELCAALGQRAVAIPPGVLEAERVPGLGFVGDPLPTAPRIVRDAVAAGLIPVVPPLARGPLNVNGDEAAVALALGLVAERLVFVTDVPGVFLDGSVAHALAPEEAERLARVSEGGMVPKLLAAARAARSGVPAEIGVTAVSG